MTDRCWVLQMLFKIASLVPFSSKYYKQTTGTKCTRALSNLSHLDKLVSPNSDVTFSSKALIQFFS